MVPLYSLVYFNFLLLFSGIKGECPNGRQASWLCADHEDCKDEKEMCLKGECCSVANEAMPCPLYSYREYALQTSYKDKCTKDTECPGWRKCCQTIIGKYCMEPEPDQGKCEDGKWPAALCLDGMTCPNGYYCTEEMKCCLAPRWKLRKCMVNVTNEELERLGECDTLVHCALGENCCQTKLGYRCVPFKSRSLIRGMEEPQKWCPLFFYDYLKPNTKDMCSNDTDCPAERKCCQTVSGKYCLIPEKKQYLCKDGKEPVSACDTKCPPKNRCVESLCCPE